MLYQLLHIVRLEGMKEIKEVRPIGNSALGQLLGEVLHELLVRLHHRPQLHYGQLFVEWDANSLDFVQAEQLLLFCQNLLQKVLVQHVLRRQVELH